MQLEKNMYVRTLKGIVKIDEIKDSVMKDTKGYLHYGDFIKASHNIIDLIEVGDYVNGCEVKKTFPNCEYAEQCIQVKGSSDYLYDIHIKSIVTKEQFEQMQYKVGE